MSLLATDDGNGNPADRLRGIELPRRDGELAETHALGYADDLVALLDCVPCLGWAPGSQAVWA